MSLYPSDILYPSGTLYPNEPQGVGTGPLVPSPLLFPGPTIYPGMTVGEAPEPSIIDAYVNLTFASDITSGPQVVVGGSSDLVGQLALSVLGAGLVNDGADIVSDTYWALLGNIIDAEAHLTSTAAFAVDFSVVVNIEVALESWLELEVDFPRAVRSTSMTHYVVGLGDDD